LKLRIEGIDLILSYIEIFHLDTAINPVDAEPPLVTSILMVGAVSFNYHCFCELFSNFFPKLQRMFVRDDFFQKLTKGNHCALKICSLCQDRKQAYTVVVNNLDGEGTVRLDPESRYFNMANVDDNYALQHYLRD